MGALPTFPTAASPSSTSFTLLLGLLAAPVSAILINNQEHAVADLARIQQKKGVSGDEQRTCCLFKSPVELIE